MYSKTESDGTYKTFGFLAPSGATNDKNEVLFPFHESQSIDFSADVEVKQMTSIIDFGTVTANKTLNLDIADQLTPGARINLSGSITGAVTVTLGTGFDGVNLVGTASETHKFYASFIYNGTSFVADGVTSKQTD